MKKLLFLSIFALFALVSANVFGQNRGTGKEPSIGSIHTYWVNSTDPDSHDGAHVGSTYTWWVSTNTSDLTQAASATDFEVVAGRAVYNTGAVNKNSIDIAWKPSSFGNTYFLVVKEQGTGALCNNMKAFAITPKNNFEVQFVLVDQNNADADVSSFCAPDISLTADATTSEITYNYGIGQYLFKLHSTGLYSNWSFDNELTNSSTTAGTTVEYKIGAATDWTTITSTVPVSANAAGAEDVHIRVTVNNGTTAGTYDEGLAQQLIKLVLKNVKDGGGNSAKITNNAGEVQSATPEQTQTVKARPATSGIFSN